MNYIIPSDPLGESISIFKNPKIIEVGKKASILALKVINEAVLQDKYKKLYIDELEELKSFIEESSNLFIMSYLYLKLPELLRIGFANGIIQLNELEDFNNTLRELKNMDFENEHKYRLDSEMFSAYVDGVRDSENRINLNQEL